MHVIESRENLLKHLSSTGGVTRGFVPTMGALHRGHLSLVERSGNDTDITVVSIFVNPAQFNDPEDLRKYPRDTEDDLKLLEQILTNNDIVFIPSVEEIYSGEEPPLPELGHLDKVMEGLFRPGHFEGVVRVVSILFSIVNPDMAYFGQKDFQQLAIIKAMAERMEMRVKIVGCPIIREDDGLAMSSRNKRLSSEIRSSASIIYSTLSKYSNLKEYKEPAKIKSKIIREIDATSGFRTEYFEIVDDVELKAINSVEEIDPGRNYYGCIAVFAGDVRLIDNVEFSFPVSKG